MLFSFGFNLVFFFTCLFFQSFPVTLESSNGHVRTIINITLRINLADCHIQTIVDKLPTNSLTNYEKHDCQPRSILRNKCHQVIQRFHTILFVQICISIMLFLDMIMLHIYSIVHLSQFLVLFKDVVGITIFIGKCP